MFKVSKIQASALLTVIIGVFLAGSKKILASPINKRELKWSKDGAILGLVGAAVDIVGVGMAATCGAFVNSWNSLVGGACLGAVVAYAALSAVQGGYNTVTVKRDGNLTLTPLTTEPLWINNMGYVNFTHEAVPFFNTEFWNEEVQEVIDAVEMSEIYVHYNTHHGNDKENGPEEESTFVPVLRFIHEGIEKFGVDLGFNYTDYIHKYANYNPSSNATLTPLSRRDYAEEVTWASYNVAWRKSITQEIDVQAYDYEDNGANMPGLDNWIGYDSQPKYCIGVGINDNYEFLAGEIYFNAYGGTDGQCYNSYT